MPHDLAISLLVRLKEDAWLKAIPVVILASPGSRLDVSECYALGAAGCMVKSNVRDELLEKLKAFSLYWRLNRLPALR
jgi:DNA-binding NarL/FixJ family response regulator